MIRPPAVAGMFYEGSEDELIRSIEECFTGRLGPGEIPKINEKRIGNVLGLVCPHAGYIYSGPAAAYSYAELAEDGLPDVAVILGPNHHGLGENVAMADEGEWKTPLGNLQIDADIAAKIVQFSKFAQIDDIAHSHEHSIEVQLPFLQYLSREQKIKIVPIALSYFNEHDSLLLAEDLGEAIARSVEGKSAVIIASTDFSHYEPHEVAVARDALAMEQILALDTKGLIHTVYSKSTMCGVAGTAVMLQACNILGASRAKKLTYHTSGDVTGDKMQVVGYGAVSILRQ